MKPCRLICVVCGVAQNRSRMVELIFALLCLSFLLFTRSARYFSFEVRASLTPPFLLAFSALVYCLFAAIRSRDLCCICCKSGLISIDSPVGREMLEKQQNDAEMAMIISDGGQNLEMDTDKRFIMKSRRL